MEFADSNRAFIQAFLAKNVMTLDQAKPILAAIWSVSERKEVDVAVISQADLNSMIAGANEALSPLDYEIRSALHQQTRERYYALVNTTSDQLTQVATTLSSDEIGYVKRLLDEMFDTNNTERREAMCIHGKDALNLIRSSRRETQGASQMGGADVSGRFNLTMSEAETLLGKLIAENWLEKSKSGFYSLSPRPLMELKSWLVETYNDEEEDLVRIKSCEACREIITIGQRCAQRDCPTRLHDICVQAFFKAQRTRHCPTCQTPWDGQHFVGEKAITTSESYLRGKRRSGLQQQSADEADSRDVTVTDSD